MRTFRRKDLEDTHTPVGGISTFCAKPFQVQALKPQRPEILEISGLVHLASATITVAVTVNAGISCGRYSD